MANSPGRPARYGTKLRISVSPSMAARLNELAEIDEVPRAQLVRTAISRLLRERGGAA